MLTRGSSWANVVAAPEAPAISAGLTGQGQ
jgi:hypothetical protein